MDTHVASDAAQTQLHGDVELDATEIVSEDEGHVVTKVWGKPWVLLRSAFFLQGLYVCSDMVRLFGTGGHV